MMADTGKAWPLVEGTGKIFGLWAIESLGDNRSLPFRDGAAQKIDFTLKLKRIDDGRVDLLGSITGAVGGVLRGML
ncbi:Phage P2 GpU [compost metagenome]